MDFPPGLVCCSHGKGLVAEEGQGPEAQASLVCPLGCRLPIVNGIPRFAASAAHTSSFGLQWMTFQKTQLDSYTGTTISRDRLTRCLGGALNTVQGRTVLEVGCGAGRFTEVLLSAGARVFACDLSGAVDAGYENCKQYSDYFVCQADVLQLPVRPEQFDIVICIGVIQHTVDPEETIAVLCSHVKPGGLLVIYHYAYGHAVATSRRLLRFFCLRMPVGLALRFCKAVVAISWPAHQVLWKYREHRGFGRLRRGFLRVSPTVDYHDAYPQLRPDHLREWAMLDTHDTLTDTYRHLRDAEEIANCLRRCGMTDIETVYAGNGVEARARKPA